MNKNTITKVIEEFREKFNLHMSKSNGEEWIGSQKGADMESFLISKLKQAEEETRKEERMLLKRVLQKGFDTEIEEAIFRDLDDLKPFSEAQGKRKE